MNGTYNPKAVLARRHQGESTWMSWGTWWTGLCKLTALHLCLCLILAPFLLKQEDKYFKFKLYIFYND